MIFALMLTACGGCSAIDDETGGDEVIEADSLVVGDQLPEFEITMTWTVPTVATSCPRYSGCGI